MIVVFTKFDQFQRDIKMKLIDEGRNLETDLGAEVERIFERYYTREHVPFIRLEGEF